MSNARVNSIVMGWYFTRTQKTNNSLSLGGSGEVERDWERLLYYCHPPWPPSHPGAVRGQIFVSPECAASGRQAILIMLLKILITSYVHAVSQSTHCSTPEASSQSPKKRRAIQDFASASKHLHTNSSRSMPTNPQTVFKDSELHMTMYLLMQVSACEQILVYTYY